MKHTYKVLAIASILLASSLGFAREPLTIIEVIDELEGGIRDCDWKTRNLTGAPKGKMLLHKKTMDDALEGLKKGREVDPKKLEEALKIHAN